MTENRNYILFSDVHLGADLVQHVRPWTIARLKEVARVDRDLGAMLDYYRERPDPERPWCMVIAGDLVDFIGMNIAPTPDDDALETALTAEERIHGLGSTEDHAGRKMRAVAQRHELVFARMAHFVAAGNSLVLVRGNHDLDFHWETAREAFVEALLHHVPELSDDKAAEFRSRVEFYPWFYYVEGLLYVEHGHQFDAMCLYPHLLAPLSPADPARLNWSFSDLLLRLVSRPTPGLGTDNHNEKGILFYLRFFASLGVVGGLRLAYRFYRAIAEGIAVSRAWVTQGARTIRAEHERRMVELARRMRVRLEQLEKLSAMWPAPVTRGAFSVLRAVFVDRLALTVLLGVTLAVLLGLGLPIIYWLISFTLALLSYVAYAMWSGPVRRRDVQPTDIMRQAARRIAEMFPTRFVIMGHTHQPGVERITEDATYVNLGYWGIDDLDGEGADPPRTHLVVRWVDGEAMAEFLRWESGSGPVPVELARQNVKAA